MQMSIQVLHFLSYFFLKQIFKVCLWKSPLTPTMHLPKTSKTNESLHIYQQESCLQDPQPFHETRKMIRSILSRLVQTLTTWSLILHPIWTSEILSGLIMQLPLSPSFIGSPGCTNCNETGGSCYTGDCVCLPGYNGTYCS